MNVPARMTPSTARSGAAPRALRSPRRSTPSTPTESPTQIATTPRQAAPRRPTSNTITIRARPTRIEIATTLNAEHPHRAPNTDRHAPTSRPPPHPRRHDAQRRAPHRAPNTDRHAQMSRTPPYPRRHAAQRQPPRTAAPFTAQPEPRRHADEIPNTPRPRSCMLPVEGVPYAPTLEHHPRRRRGRRAQPHRLRPPAPAHRHRAPAPARQPARPAR